MIVFDLECRVGGHRFEGWFASSEDFAGQQARDVVAVREPDDGHTRDGVDQQHHLVTAQHGQQAVRGDSVLSLMALGAKHGEKLMISVSGADEQQVLNQLTSLF